MRSQLARYKEMVESHLDDLAWRFGKVPSLKDAMVYAMQGGKRLRGAILLGFFEALGGTAGDALDFAAAVEMIHGYSLVHDDLPCMDNDDYRRGKPSCHKAFGYATALLAGDALLTLAFETAAASRGFSPSAIASGIATLASAAGPRGMVGGQMLDLAMEGKAGGVDKVRQMYRMKTGALFGAAARIGVILAGGDEEKAEAAERWGVLFGYAFQIADDLDDLAQGDRDAGKDTVLSEVGVKAALEEAAASFRASLGAIEVFGQGATLPQGLSRMYLEKTEGGRVG